MANLANPQGARPMGVPLRQSPYVAGGTIYPGDLLTQNSSGQVVVASASSALVGAAAAYATSGQTVMVYDEPDQLFIMECSSGSISAQTNINNNADFVAASANTTYKISKHVIDGSTLATTATLPLKLLRIEPSVNNAFGANVDVVVKINNHQLSGGTGTAGV